MPEPITAEQRVLAVQGLATPSFAFLTDPHYAKGDASILRTLGAVQLLAQNINLDFLAIGGDNTADGTRASLLSNYEDLSYRFKTILKGIRIFPVKGNHDDGSIYNVSYVPGPATEVVYPGEEYARIFKQIENAVVRDDAKQDLYYYYEAPDAKIRYIFLNTIDIPYIIEGDGTLRYKGQWKYAFSNEQLHWVADKALDFSSKGPDKSSWGVVFIAHIPPVLALQAGLGDIENSNVFIGIMQAFKSGTAYVSPPTAGDFAQSVNVDFASQGAGDIIAYIYGHVHVDAVNIVNGITYISTLNANCSKDSGPAPERTIDTATEMAFDVFTINRAQKKIYATRVGAGMDRVVDY